MKRSTSNTSANGDEGRVNRKNDHIKYALALSDGPLTSGFADMHVMHDCLPEINCDQVNLATCLADIKMVNPFIINAMTGGADNLTTINRQLAIVARETSCALAVGSQYGSIKSGKYTDSFTVVRRENPSGIIFANVSALATVDEGQRAVDMLEAQALQIHLNVAQELAMQEGDREFSGYLKNIEQLCLHLNVPVIVKETGAGMARREVKTLFNLGVNAVDIGGSGGTNFPAIEAARCKATNCEITDWGISTVLSLYEAARAIGKQNGIVATGGIRTALDALKALILGANAVGMAGNVLKNLTDGGIETAVCEMHKLQSNLIDFMILTGCKKIEELPKVPVYFTGDTFMAMQCLS